MKIRDLIGRARKPVIFLVTAATLTAFGTLASFTLPQYVVSQKGREFTPGNITIRHGETVEIVNDDGDLRHHAYIDSDNFSYDSGDQEPGTKTSITFPTAGDFDVLCAIHPKMKLTVHVK